MGQMLPTVTGAQQVLPTNRAMGYSSGVLSNARLPSDALFFANIILQNIVVGSRYWVAQASDLSNVLVTGLAATGEVVVSNVPSYANPMLIEVRVRSASGITKYAPYKTFGYLVKTGATVYVAQVESSVLNG